LLDKVLAVSDIYLFLFIITFSMAFMIGAITAYVTVKSLLFCIGVLCVSVVSLCGAALVTPLSAKLVMFLLIGLVVGCLLQLVALIALCFTGACCSEGDSILEFNSQKFY